jgi:hypothetical protein
VTTTDAPAEITREALEAEILKLHELEAARNTAEQEMNRLLTALGFQV